MKQINAKILIEFVAVLSLTLIFLFAHSIYQPQILAGNGYGWDGLEYSKLWNFFSLSHSSKISFPFCNRIGTPYLASLTRIGDEFLSFRIINTSFAILFSLATWEIARAAGFNSFYRLFATSLSLIAFFSPARFIPFYPVYTDPAFLALVSISYLCLQRGHIGLAFLFLTISFPFREASVYIAPIFLFTALYLYGYSKKTLIKFFSCILAIILIKVFISNQFDCSGSQIRTALGWAIRGFSDPIRFVSCIAAISMTAAPVFYAFNNTNFSKLERSSLYGFIFAALMAFVGGSDSTRIFYSFLPIYIVSLLSIIRSQGYGFAIICSVGFAVTNRLGSKIAEPQNYWPARDESGLFWQFPDHARPEVGLLILAAWLVLFIFYEKIFIAIKRRDNSSG